MSISQSLALVCKSYGFFFAHFIQFLRLTVPWSLLAGVIAFANDDDVMTVCDLLFLPVGSALISVTWYRAMLLNEELWPPRGFGKREWLFLIVAYIPIVFSLGFAFLLWVAWLLLEPNSAWSQDTAWLNGPIPSMVVDIAWMLGVTPLVLAFPKIAVENGRLRLVQSMRMSRPVLFPIFVGIVAVSLPILVADGLTFGSGLADSKHSIAYAAINTVNALVSFACDAAIVGFGAHLYRTVRPGV